VLIITQVVKSINSCLRDERSNENTSRLRDEKSAYAKMKQQNTSRWRDEKSAYAKTKQQNTSRLRDEKSILAKINNKNSNRRMRTVA
jgi:hypothetical protein